MHEYWQKSKSNLLDKVKLKSLWSVHYFHNTSCFVMLLLSMWWAEEQEQMPVTDMADKEVPGNIITVKIELYYHLKHKTTLKNSSILHQPEKHTQHSKHSHQHQYLSSDTLLFQLIRWLAQTLKGECFQFKGPSCRIWTFPQWMIASIFTRIVSRSWCNSSWFDRPRRWFSLRWQKAINTQQVCGAFLQSLFTVQWATWDVRMELDLRPGPLEFIRSVYSSSFFYRIKIQISIRR